MATPWTVRPARPEEAETIAAFQVAMARETEDKGLDPQRLARGVASVFANPARGRYLVVERDGRVQGSLLLTLEWSDWRDAEFWWIQSVYVRPEARGQGAFGALYRAVEAEARDRGAAGLRLYVEHDNEHAQTVYGGLGMSASHYRMFELDLPLGGAPDDAR